MFRVSGFSGWGPSVLFRAQRDFVAGDSGDFEGQEGLQDLGW